MALVIKFSDDFVTESTDSSIVAQAPTATIAYEFDKLTKGMEPFNAVPLLTDCITPAKKHIAA